MYVANPIDNRRNTVFHALVAFRYATVNVIPSYRQALGQVLLMALRTVSLDSVDHMPAILGCASEVVCRATRFSYRRQGLGIGNPFDTDPIGEVSIPSGFTTNESRSGWIVPKERLVKL